MSISRQEVEEGAKLLIRDESLPTEMGFKDGEFGEMIRMALGRYSKDRPLKDFADMAGDGSMFDFDLPADWDNSVSIPLRVEYPQGEQVPVYLQQREWTIYASGTSAQKLRCLTFKPASGKTARLFFTKRHVVSEIAAQTTISENDQSTFVRLVAAEACYELARRFAQTSIPSLGADAIDYKSKSAEFTNLARDLMRQYANHFGMKGGDTAGPAGSTLDLDASLSQIRGDYLTHGSPGER